MPECDCILAQAVVHLAEAPKSIRVYAGYNKAKALVRKEEAYPVPLHIRLDEMCIKRFVRSLTDSTEMHQRSS